MALIGMMLACSAMMRVAIMPVSAQVAQISTTTVTDTIYLADGSTAAGTVIVSWPAFTTAAGQAVPAGTTSATIGTGGTLTMQLVPNAGSTPMGSYYTAVYHLSDGTVSREFWVVPASQARARDVQAVTRNAREDVRGCSAQSGNIRNQNASGVLLTMCRGA